MNPMMSPTNYNGAWSGSNYTAKSFGKKGSKSFGKGPKGVLGKFGKGGKSGKKGDGSASKGHGKAVKK